jgi:transcriptional regulator with GAF, ATPase, and Fis domain
MSNGAPLVLLHDVWREVSRHLEIGESVEALFPLVAAHVAVRWIVVRRVTPDRGRLESVGAAGDLAEGLPLRTEVPVALRGALGGWLDAGRVATWRSLTDPAGVRGLITPLPGAVAAGPLRQGDKVLGVLALGGDSALLDATGVVEALLEPFAAAMTNDGRLHELARLRERAEADNRALLTRLQRQDVSEAIVGAEAGLRTVMEQVDQVARTDAPVLILGETGSGKEVVARAIHQRSRRVDGPFLRINCGAIPPDLVDSELFGHERGAFTGAVGVRKGWFERSDGGTLFLDEVGDLPAAAQVRLLRVLQDGSFMRVGGQHVMTCDVRVVAATHRDLPALVRSGVFREDLWYRISVFPVRLPPLRERQQDIPALARHFSERAGVRLAGMPILPTGRDLQVLGSYAWPGNVRELAAVIERAAILGDGRRLEMGAALGNPVHADPSAPAPAVAPIVEGATREDIVASLRRCHGRIEGPFGAARALGVNPHTLRSRMRRLGIDWSEFRSANAGS